MGIVLSWQATVAIVGSVVAIVTGIFGYLIKSRDTIRNKDIEVLSSDISDLRNRITNVKDHLTTAETDIKLITQRSSNSQSAIESYEQILERRLEDHITRSRSDFSALSTKLDKVTDVIMKMLSDERL